MPRRRVPTAGQPGNAEPAFTEAPGLLEMMIPAGLPLDDEETLRARIGLVRETAVEAFRGGFNEGGVGVSRPPSQAALMARRKEAA